MAWIKAKNGNLVEFEDDALGVRALKDEHEVFETDPRDGSAKPWKPPVEEDEADGEDAADTKTAAKKTAAKQ